MKVFKRIKDAYKLYQASKEPMLLMSMQAIKTVIDKTISEGVPITQKIVMDFKGVPEMRVDVISLWAHVGDNSPFDRLVELREQRDAFEVKFMNSLQITAALHRYHSSVLK